MVWVMTGGQRSRVRRSARIPSDTWVWVSIEVFLGWGVPAAAIVLAADWSPWLKALAVCVLLPVVIAVVRLVNRWVDE